MDEISKLSKAGERTEQALWTKLQDDSQLDEAL
jgi:hypothetical protein